MFSQNNEEEVILSVLPKVGRFLDIGAFHPTQLSNTRALYERGWSGVMVEPSPGPMLTLIEAYGYDPKVTLVQALIGERSGGPYAMDVTRDAVSTTSEQVRDIWWKDGGYNGRILVPQLSVDVIIDIAGMCEFVDIDAEGESANIFLAFLQTKIFRPLCYCVEHDSREAEITEKARESGYSPIHQNGENIIFLRCN